MYIRKLFLQYLYDRLICPYAPINGIFATDEYQSYVGILQHIHKILIINFDQSNVYEGRQINDLIRAFVCDNV